MSADRIVSLESSLLPMPRHWAFASVVAWENISIMFQDASLMLSSAYLLDQLAAEFQADPLVQSDPQQRALWARLREQIGEKLAEELRDLPIAAPV